MSRLAQRAAAKTADASPPRARRRLFTRSGAAPSGDGWRDDARDFELAVEVPGVLDAHQCDVLLGYIADFGHGQGKVGTEDGSGAELDVETRQVRQTHVPRSPETAWLYERVAGVIDDRNRESFGFDLRDFSEDFAIVDYRSGDFYEWHLDVGRGASSRKLSVSVMLSSPEDYDGGALVFPSIEFARVARGSALVFPSFLLHGVQPVKRGRRCALLAWVGGPRFR